IVTGLLNRMSSKFLIIGKLYGYPVNSLFIISNLTDLRCIIRHPLHLSFSDYTSFLFHILWIHLIIKFHIWFILLIIIQSVLQCTGMEFKFMPIWINKINRFFIPFIPWTAC